ncbi:MAG: hypothetical protein ACFCUW_03830 [Kiloniellaceae bacterium]
MNANNQPPPQAVANLPIFDTLIAAFTAAYSDPALLLRAAAGGLLLLGATTVVALVLPPNPFTLLLMLLAPIAAYSHFGVNWYRVMLLGPAGLVRPVLRWDRRHWRFFGFGLMLGTGLLVFGGMLTMVLPVPSAVVAIGLLYLASRCCFLFPALAVEEPYSFAYAWQHTKGQGWRLTLLLLLAGIPLMLAVSLLVSALFTAVVGVSLFDLAAVQMGGTPAPGAGQLTDDGQALEVSPIATLTLKMVTEALSMAVLAVLYSIVALAFRTCTGWVPAAPATLPAPQDEDRNGGF